MVRTLCPQKFTISFRDLSFLIPQIYSSQKAECVSRVLSFRAASLLCTFYFFIMSIVIRILCSFSGTIPWGVFPVMFPGRRCFIRISVFHFQSHNSVQQVLRVRGYHHFFLCLMSWPFLSWNSKQLNRIWRIQRCWLLSLLVTLVASRTL